MSKSGSRKQREDNILGQKLNTKQNYFKCYSLRNLQDVQAAKTLGDSIRPYLHIQSTNFLKYETVSKLGGDNKRSVK
jgi:hypothetical protein